ncbi:hypothetical protein [Angustibacter sp. Root456]|uniref:hypothetical protein n=1 Tax=Angustibacter sp. Root456 TaxID=1736539 RepID=UPI0006F8A140|nr:hypothetical protein [Angustibacter sp. Root456]KQX63657.1 hypothetical protein ASD06_11035 [Angustibacter sp. Root456]
MSALGLAGVVVERNVLTYRRQWVAFLTGFLEPVFYLFSLGVGLGALIGRIPLADGRLVTCAQFMAPAMLAMSAMNGAVFDATYNMFFKLCTNGKKISRGLGLLRVERWRVA